MHANGIKTGSPKLKNTYWYPPRKNTHEKNTGHRSTAVSIYLVYDTRTLYTYVPEYVKATIVPHVTPCYCPRLKSIVVTSTGVRDIIADRLDRLFQAQSQPLVSGRNKKETRYDTQKRARSLAISTQSQIYMSRTSKTVP